jgi:hypothetical protein
MIDLHLDQADPSVFAPLELIGTSSAETHETHHAHLIVVAVALVDKPLLP